MAIGGTNYGTLQIRQGSPAALAADNPIPATGEYIASFDGTTRVLKIGDGVQAWLDLPEIGGGGGGGSGGVLGWAYASALASEELAITGGRKLALADWQFTDYHGTVGGVGDAADYGWGYTEAGWYQVKFDVRVGFTAGALALPESLFVELLTSEGMTLMHEIPLSAAPGMSSTGRTLYGGMATITTAIYWAAAASTTPDLQNAHQLDFRWKGDATIRSATNGAPNEICQMEISRLSDASV